MVPQTMQTLGNVFAVLAKLMYCTRAEHVFPKRSALVSSGQYDSGGKVQGESKREERSAKREGSLGPYLHEGLVLG